MDFSIQFYVRGLFFSPLTGASERRFLQWHEDDIDVLMTDLDITNKENEELVF